MKIAVTSDVHLEFGQLELDNTDNADVLILSGDICVANDLAERDSFNIRGEHDRSNRFHEFFQMCSARFPQVLYVMGNHEHYHGDFAKSATILRERLSYLPNLHFLDKQSIIIDDVTFIGGTLWTDMNNEDTATMRSIRSMMNDFRCVENSNREVSYKVNVPLLDHEGNMRRDDAGNALYQAEFRTRVAEFSPEDAVVDHREMLQYIDAVLAENKTSRYVVVGHHAPSKTSTHPRYKHETIMNGAYSSDLTEFILDRRQIKLWTHGHTHEDFDYMIGTTRIFCNPRGYINYESRADNFQLRTVEI